MKPIIIRAAGSMFVFAYPVSLCTDQSGEHLIVEFAEPPTWLIRLQSFKWPWHVSVGARCEPCSSPSSSDGGYYFAG